MACYGSIYGPCVDHTPAIIGGIFGGLAGLMLIIMILAVCHQSAKKEDARNMPRASRDCENPTRYEMARRDHRTTRGHDHSGAIASGGDGGGFFGGGGDVGGGGGGGNGGGGGGGC